MIKILKKAQTNGQCIQDTILLLILGSIVKTLKHGGSLFFFKIWFYSRSPPKIIQTPSGGIKMKIQLQSQFIAKIAH